MLHPVTVIDFMIYFVSLVQISLLHFHPISHLLAHYLFSSLLSSFTIYHFFPLPFNVYYLSVEQILTTIE